MKIEVVKPLQFQYAAGKVSSGPSGTYVDGANEPSAFDTAQVSFIFASDGTWRVEGLNALPSSIISSGNWYTGGVPSAGTSFSLQVLSRTGTGTATSGNTNLPVGTYNFSDSVSFAVRAASSGSQTLLINYQLTITRASVSVVYTFSGRATVA